MQSILRHLQLASSVVRLTYLSLRLENHALGIWSLDLAARGTVLLYGSAGLHFALALHTVYERRHHWTLPLAERIRPWAGLSLPVLIIRRAVATHGDAALRATIKPQRAVWREERPAADSAFRRID